MKLDKVKKELYILNDRFKKILSESDFEDWYAAQLEYDTQNPNEVQLANEYCRIIAQFECISGVLDYYALPIAKEGKLRMNQNGRYELNGIELTCGEGVEVLLYDDCMERWEWYASSIELENGKYFLVGRNCIDLDGMNARQRERRW